MKCFLCENETKFIEYLEKEGIKYIQCKYCSLIFIAEKYGTNVLRKTYDDKDYFSGYIENYKKFIGIFNRIISFIEKFKSPGKILDIGCAIGFLLYVAKKRNWDVYGIEVSKFASQFAKNKLKLNVINSDNLNSFLDNFFDVIVINHVLEHIENPLLILKQIHKKLNRRGILLIGVPNINSLYSRLQNENWPYLQPSTHIYQFTPKTLKLLLEKVGFKHIKLYTENRHFKYKFRILNLILNRIVNPILEKLKLGEAMTFIFIKKDD